MEKIPGTVDVSISREANNPELKIDVDREKAASLGLDMNTIATTLKAFIQGTTATKYRENGKTYDIYVRLEEYSRTKLEDIENLTIMAPLPVDNAPFVGLEVLASRQGVKRAPLEVAPRGAGLLTGRAQIKLSNIAKIYETSGPDRIERKNRERMVRAQCNVYKRSSGKIVEDLNSQISKLVLPAFCLWRFPAVKARRLNGFNLGYFIICPYALCGVPQEISCLKNTGTVLFFIQRAADV